MTKKNLRKKIHMIMNIMSKRIKICKFIENFQRKQKMKKNKKVKK